MAFKIPKINIANIGAKQQRSNKFSGFRLTLPGEIDIISTVGRGSFGVVKLCRKKKDSTQLILKEMIDLDGDHDELFIKEAKLMLSMIHINIVRFDSLFESSVPGTFAFLMEYLYFDFSLFGQEARASSLKEYLKCVDTFNCKDFEHLQTFISRDVSRGLTFLHDNDIVHRDLKPENILVSNQHYTMEHELVTFWGEKPIVAKLTDFGESRSTILQTASLLHTKTNNISRGTPVYMAPEAHHHDGKRHVALDELKSMDMWSFGMILYMLINPDKRYPFEDEVKSFQRAGVAGKDIMQHVFNKIRVPEHGSKYEVVRRTLWKKIVTAFERCTQSSSRPSATEIYSLLEKKIDLRKHNRNIFEEIMVTGDEDGSAEELLMQHLVDKDNSATKEITAEASNISSFSVDSSLRNAEGSIGIKVDDGKEDLLQENVAFENHKPAMEFKIKVDSEPVLDKIKIDIIPKPGGLKPDDTNCSKDYIPSPPLLQMFNHQAHKSAKLSIPISMSNPERMNTSIHLPLQDNELSSSHHCSHPDKQANFNWTDRKCKTEIGTYLNANRFSRKGLGPYEKATSRSHNNKRTERQTYNNSPVNPENNRSKNDIVTNRSYKNPDTGNQVNDSGYKDVQTCQQANRNRGIGAYHQSDNTTHTDKETYFPQNCDQDVERGSYQQKDRNTTISDFNRAVLGDFHQASPNVFNHAAAGSQCCSICLVAIVSTVCKSPIEWTSADINAILKEGDAIHIKTLKRTGWPYTRTEPQLDIDELPKTVKLDFNDKVVVANVSVLNKIVYGLASHIEELVQSAVEIGDFVLRFREKCIAIFRNVNGTFSLLDPHSCNKYGSTEPEGAACLLHFSTLLKLKLHMTSLVGKCTDHQVDLAVCEVEVVSQTSMSMIGSKQISKGKENGNSANSFTIIIEDSECSMDKSASQNTEIYSLPSLYGSSRNISNIAESSEHTVTVDTDDDSDFLPSYESVEMQSSDITLEDETCDEDTEQMIISSDSSDADLQAKQLMNSETTETRYPVYSRKQKGLPVHEIIQLCQFTKVKDDQLCKHIPEPRKNSVFVVDLKEVHVKDLPCDDTGIYKSHSSPTVVVEINVKNNKVEVTKTVSRKKILIEDPILKKNNVFTVKRMYSEKDDRLGLGKSKRIISKVYSRSGLAKYAIIQYVGDPACSNSGHKNSKKNKGPYFRTKPSVIDEEKNLIEQAHPKRVISIIEKKQGGPINMPSCSDGPRDRQQIYNLKRNLPNKHKSRNTGPVIQPDFSRLISDMDTGKFVKNVDFSSRVNERIHPNTFAMTHNSVSWLKKFCHPSSKTKSQVGIDMTYKVGPFYTTCLSFAHPYLVHKHDTEIHPTLFAGMMTSTGRKEDDYRYLANQLRSSGINQLIYGTDGEYALEKGFELIYPIEGVSDETKSIKLRCFNHVKDDLLAELKKYDISSQAEAKIVDELLGKEFNGVRTQGLADVEEQSFERIYKELSASWPYAFKTYMESTKLRVRSLKSTILKSMGKEVRTQAGLGNPPNKYDNQRAESINLVLKESVGGQYVDQSSVHGLVYDNIVVPQENEMIKSIYGCGEYRLSGEMKKHEISPNIWKTMNHLQRKHHAAKVLLGKITEDPRDISILRKLSVQPEEITNLLQLLPAAKIAKLWNHAEKVLSHSSIQEFPNGNFGIAEDENIYVVKQNKEMFTCNCPEFLKFNICPHVLVVADEKSCLMPFVSKYEYNPSAAVNKHNVKGAGEKRTKKPRKGAQNVKRKPIEKYTTNTNTLPDVNLKEKRPFQFSAIWHNDEEFKVIYVSSEQIKNKTILKCTSCNNNISKKNAVAPFDIVMTHQERYLYPQKSEDGTLIMKPTISKQAMKMYCVKRNCILSRHPYFWQGILNITAITPLESHKKLFKEEFNLDI